MSAPDPRQPENCCEEVQHQGLIIVREAHGPLRDGLLLMNVVTQERHAVPPGSTLHFQGKYAFVCADGVAKWASQIFEWSVWRKDGRLFCFRTHASGWESKWIDDLSKEYTIHYHAMLQVHDGKFKIFVFHARHACKALHFWALDDVLKALKLPDTSAYISQGFARGWKTALARFGCDTHVITAVGAKSDDDTGAKLHATALSTLGLLIWLLHQSQHGHTDLVKSNASQVLQALLQHGLPSRFNIPVHLTEHPSLMPYTTSNTAKLILTVNDKVLDVTPVFKTKEWHALPQKTRKGFPKQSSFSPALVSEVLVMLYPRLTSTLQLMKSLLFHIAETLEDNFVNLDVPCDPLSNADYTFRRRSDPALRRALAISSMTQCKTRNGSRLSSAAKVVGRDLGTSETYHITYEAYLYYLALRCGFSQAIHIGLAMDGTRLSSRSRLAGVAIDLDSGLAGWLPLQACKFYSHSPKTPCRHNMHSLTQTLSHKPATTQAVISAAQIL